MMFLETGFHFSGNRFPVETSNRFHGKFFRGRLEMDPPSRKTDGPGTNRGRGLLKEAAVFETLSSE
jgi:hypothetical protein